MTKKEKLYWIKVALDSGFDDEYSAEQQLEHILDILNNLPDEVILYRVVFLDSLSDLNKVKPGTHYVLDEKSLLRNHYLMDIVSSHSQGENAYLITIKVSKDKIDISTTIDNNLRYPNEEEISLKNKGSGAKIIKIKKIK
jgi:hypothetical protein